jgi:hypothetical protein
MQKQQRDISLVDKAQGCFLGLLVGDALGTAVEGFPPSEISSLAQSVHPNCQFITDYIPAIQMGSVTPLGNIGQYTRYKYCIGGFSEFVCFLLFLATAPTGTEIGYRWADRVGDETFVSPGPTPNPRLQAFLRKGTFLTPAVYSHSHKSYHLSHKNFFFSAAHNIKEI